MTFGAHVLALLEDALAECFQYHTALDTFLHRSGVKSFSLAAARQRAEERNKVSGRFSKAPKRLVAQEILHDLGAGLTADDQLVATLITEFCKGSFPEASQLGQAAIEGLKKAKILDQKETAECRVEQERRQQEKIKFDKANKRQELHSLFLKLNEESDHQQRGFALERFLSDLFEFEGLDPRASFKIKGEQIDGSFVWANRTHLVEAKWVKLPVAGADFGAFDYKIDGKTADTRGLYISINGYSPPAITGLNGKGKLRFICIDGAHLLRCLEPDRHLKKVLEILWRHADETGEAYLPISSNAFLNRGG